MSYTKETYTAPTYTKTEPGLGIMCDNEDIYCDSEKYYCDGAIIMTNTNKAVSTIAAFTTTSKKINNLGHLWYDKEEY